MSLTHDELWAGEISYSSDQILDHESLPLAAVDTEAWVSEFDSRNVGDVWYSGDAGTDKQRWVNDYTAHLVAFSGWTEARRQAAPGVLFVGDSIMNFQFTDITEPGRVAVKPGKQFMDAGYTPLNFAVKGDYIERMIYRVKTLRDKWPSLTSNALPDVPYAVIHAGVNNVNSVMGEQLHPARNEQGQPPVTEFKLGQRGWASHPFNDRSGNWRFTGRALAKSVSKLIDELHALWPTMKIVVVGFPDRKIDGSTPGYVEGKGQALGRSVLWDFRGVPATWKPFFQERNWLWAQSPPSLKVKLNAGERQRRCNWQLYQMKQQRFRGDSRVKLISSISPDRVPGTDQDFYAHYEHTHPGTDYVNLYQLTEWGGLHWSVAAYEHVNSKILRKLA